MVSKQTKYKLGIKPVYLRTYFQRENITKSQITLLHVKTFRAT